MADLDWIYFCWTCMAPVEGCRKCPQCKGDLRRMVSTCLVSVLQLHEKGWNIIWCRLEDIGAKQTVSAGFSGHSPGKMKGCHIRTFYRQGEGKQEPVGTCCTSRRTGGFRDFYDWACKVPTFADSVPFNRKFCERCHEQHDDDWFHGSCHCPASRGDVNPGGIGHHEFRDGLPDKCFYVAEQVMTRPEVLRDLGLTQDG